MATLETTQGTVAPGFEPVRDAFEENFRSRDDVGAAFSALASMTKPAQTVLIVDGWPEATEPATDEERHEISWHGGGVHPGAAGARKGEGGWGLGIGTSKPQPLTPIP